MLDNKVNHVFVITLKDNFQPEAENQSDLSVHLGCDRLDYLFKNKYSCSPFDRVLNYTIIDFEKAVDPDAQDFTENAQKLSTIIESQQETANSIAFALENYQNGNVGSEIEALWLVSLYLSIWFAEKYKQVSMKLALQIITERIDLLGNSYAPNWF